MAAMAPALLVLTAALLPVLSGAAENSVFQVRRKFPAGGTGEGGNISHLRAHDGARHGRLLAAVDLPLGGLGLPTDSGYVPTQSCHLSPFPDPVWGFRQPPARRLYYTEIRIGTPPKRYYVQVDTGSDILWVNCISCDRCPSKSGLGVRRSLQSPHLFFLFLFPFRRFILSSAQPLNDGSRFISIWIRFARR
jgi:hypothetical protein